MRSPCCLTVPLYRNYFIALMIGGLAGCAGLFFLLFYRDTLALNLDDLGKIFSAGGIATALAYVPIGWLCDKFTPFRVVIVAQVGGLIVTYFRFS